MKEPERQTRKVRRRYAWWMCRVVPCARTLSGADGAVGGNAANSHMMCLLSWR
eukprot:CAMPEP_0203850540 /NCGR_PEP_ID=MMETSP0359-20131031/6823_1 /ASSEMBLY_ACC=CAM_ASM_000338 /TAXON_ID=268821 /ORGANISM="Scrippsiella Hangoei, Strain SHTV-5" /LENGTH=52 /DNA_ID=CAMNT_0050766431 /DNA_START=65 /DNA_END=219 /DNA_ORIENTATION=-